MLEPFWILLGCEPANVDGRVLPEEDWGDDEGDEGAFSMRAALSQGVNPLIERLMAKLDSR